MLALEAVNAVMPFLCGMFVGVVLDCVLTPSTVISSTYNHIFTWLGIIEATHLSAISVNQQGVMITLQKHLILYFQLEYQRCAGRAFVVHKFRLLLPGVCLNLIYKLFVLCVYVFICNICCSCNSITLLQKL